MNQAETILEALGGWDNITVLETCITRICIEVKDDEAVDEKPLHGAGAFGIIAVDKSIQVVTGPETEIIVDTIEALRWASPLRRP